MPFLDVMHSYFRGEKLEALYFIVPIGVLLIVVAAIALKVERPGFAWGVAVPFILFGLISIAVGASVGGRTASQVAQLEARYEQDPSAMVSEELPRMQKVGEAFALYIKGYLAIVLIGLGLRFGLHADWATGLGSALVLIGGLGFMIDGFAERRAHPYTAALEELARQGAPHAP